VPSFVVTLAGLLIFNGVMLILLLLGPFSGYPNLAGLGADEHVLFNLMWGTIDPLTSWVGMTVIVVGLAALKTLWINTGTLCNLTCKHCYIESSPRNDALAYISAAEVAAYLDEIAARSLPVNEIGFTGGEPFMNPEFPAMLEAALHRGFRVLVLTNAMRPMMKLAAPLAALNERFPRRLIVRVSLDHYSGSVHEIERGRRSWGPAVAGLKWLVENGFAVHVDGRRFSGEPEPVLRAGYDRLFREHRLPIDPFDPVQLVLFPEMDAKKDVPEITIA